MQVNLEYKQEKKIFFKLHLVFSTPRKAFIYGLFRNFSSYSNSSHRRLISVISIAFSLLFIVVFAILAGIILTGIKLHSKCTHISIQLFIPKYRNYLSLLHSPLNSFIRFSNSATDILLYILHQYFF